MVLRLTKASASVIVAGFLLLMVLIGTRVPMPAGAGPAEIVSRTWHGFLAEVDVRLGGTEHRLDGARELVRLDPKLSKIGRQGAEILVQESPDFDERLAFAQRLLDAEAAGPELVADVLLEGLRSEPEPQRIQTVVEQASTLPADQASRVLGRAANLVLELGDAGLVPGIATQVAAVSKEPGRSKLLAQLIDHLLSTGDPAMITQAGQLASGLDSAHRGAVAERLISPELVAVLGETTAVQLAAGVERTEAVVHLERLIQARAQVRAGQWPSVVGLTVGEALSMLGPYGYVLDPAVHDPAELNAVIVEQSPPGGTPRGDGWLAVSC